LGQSPTNLALAKPSNGVTPADVTIQSGVILAAGQSVGLLARYSGPGDQNFYEARLTLNSNALVAAIYRNVNGAFTLLASKTISKRTFLGLFKFNLVGSSLSLFLNDSLLASATDTSLTAGSVGVRLGANSGVNNFTVS
jgi:hypothetical protein